MDSEYELNDMYFLADIDECASSPCLNGGTCVDGVNGYTCGCIPGYEGLHCDVDIDECASSPCLNGGTCTDGIDGYACTCIPGYAGLNCDIDIDECASSPCLNGGTCTDGIDGYACTCIPGYEGLNCDVDTDECTSSPCLNGGTCVDGINGYTCTCIPGYEGVHCDVDIDECTSTNPCLNGGTCVDGVNGYTCTCIPGYEGLHCDVDTDECTSSPCLNGGTCVDGVNGYTCTCIPGYEGVHCDVDTDECTSSPCLNGGTCVDGVNGYTCTCIPGYEGVHCDVDIDECASSPCLNSGTCVDGVNRYTCTCIPGYEGLHCDVDIDECTSTNPCLNGGTCVDGVNGYTCTCIPGYEGVHCDVDIDECTSTNPCSNGGTCVDGVNGYTCTCIPGYEGVHCDVDIDECTSTNPCLNGGTCVDGINGYTCTCIPGYEGLHCDVDIDECTSTNPCLNGGTCVDGVNGYTCTCIPGYEGVHCDVDIDECTSTNPCLNGGTCVDGINGYTCTCIPGYEGLHCDVDIDECTSTNPCLNGGTCVDGINGYTCTCIPGYEGLHCDLDIDECASSPCLNGGTCVDGVDGYICSCVHGYEGPDCEDIAGRLYVSSISPFTDLKFIDGLTYGMWGKDPLSDTANGTVIQITGTSSQQMTKYSSMADFISNTNPVSHNLHHSCEGDGYVFYNGSLYYPMLNYNKIVRYNIDLDQSVTSTLPVAIGTHNTYQYQWGGYSDIDFAVDEYGLWMIYATSDNLGKFVVSKVDPIDCSFLQTWITDSPTKGITGQAFMVSGMLYVVNSYSSMTHISYVYDTFSSTGKTLSLSDIPIGPGHGYLTHMSYMPGSTSSGPVLNTWDDMYASTYDVSLSNSVSWWQTRMYLSHIDTAIDIRSGGNTHGAWLMDPAFDFVDRKFWVLEGYNSFNTFLRYDNSADFVADNNSALVSLPSLSCDGTGHVIWNDYFYCHEAYTSNILKFDLLGNPALVSSTLLSGAGNRNTYAYKWGGYTDIDLAVDESDLWVMYGDTIEATGNIKIAKINKQTMTIETTWSTARSKTSSGNAFIISGIMYVLNSYSSPSYIDYVYDTNTGTDASLGPSDIPWPASSHGYLTQLTYIHGQEPSLLAYDDGFIQEYPVTLVPTKPNWLP
ncbi:unnamed protein product [Owenia fusiformis]|uniref:Uncharacterized protein n=1 Tax=Owenia fusiformis TaxID=6347 RepID=A0A8S4NM72_OWEFU|nr:unnamed protein product [Owenia fusiformis]